MDTRFLWTDLFGAIVGLAVCSAAFMALWLLVSGLFESAADKTNQAPATCSYLWAGGIAGTIVLIPAVYFLVRFIKWAWETPIPWAR